MAKKVIYGLLDRPPFPIMVLAGAQHVLTLFGATTLVPLIFGPAMGMDQLQIAALISCVYFGMGVATLIQTHPKLGSGLPIVQGSSFSFIPSVMTIIGAYKAMGPDVVMQYMGGGLILGGIILSVIGYTGIIGYIRKIITPVVIGPVIMAIGFSLAPTAIQFNAANYWPISLMVVALIFIFSLVSKNKYANIFAILSSIVLTYLVCLGLTKIGVFPAGHPAHVDLSRVAEAPWLRYNVIMPWGAPKFSMLAFGALLAGFFAVMIESVGDYHSVSYASGLDDPDEGTISRGIGAEGLNCALSGLFGSVGTTSYTENIGLIGLTGVASRWVVRTGAVLLILMSFVTKLGALVATMPSPVIGGAYIALFGTIGALGIQVLMRADMGSQRNVLIVGFAFLMAMGLPGWIEQNQSLFMNPDYNPFLQTLGGMVWAILKTPMAVAGICAAFCDSLVPGTDEERGIGVRMK
ncbi:solute carrier family 23 protein [Aminivibrio sp.]|jgi:uracil-xanthine permease|uniref:uracil-xanthine permease family protein n=1 Tax=Aminivibrio sp. TaxID=1872489 RepID=UPI001A625833|nr:solute carrier family 23 protein [Aminivibrio sp.]MBL3538331.1 purine/pyrimidine permease [Aminivibrio sp.]MDK2959606.1 solute carrier family 23 (nucleobase transporter), er 1 [Synergistaceae bacterium]